MMAIGADIGAAMLLFPGFVVVHLAATPPPEPPSTTVHVSGMPAENVSLSTLPAPGCVEPTPWLNDPIHDPSLLWIVIWNATALPQARLVGSSTVK
jgi:hypothetical protein